MYPIFWAWQPCAVLQPHSKPIRGNLSYWLQWHVSCIQGCAEQPNLLKLFMSLNWWDPCVAAWWRGHVQFSGLVVLCLIREVKVLFLWNSANLNSWLWKSVWGKWCVGHLPALPGVGCVAETPVWVSQDEGKKLLSVISDFKSMTFSGMWQF